MSRRSDRISKLTSTPLPKHHAQSRTPTTKPAPSPKPTSSHAYRLRNTTPSKKKQQDPPPTPSPTQKPPKPQYGIIYSDLVSAPTPVFDYAATRVGSMAYFLRRVYTDSNYASSILHLSFDAKFDKLEYTGLLITDNRPHALDPHLRSFDIAIVALMGQYGSAQEIPLSEVVPLYAELFSVCAGVVTVTMPRAWGKWFPVRSTFPEVEARFMTCEFGVPTSEGWIRYGRKKWVCQS